jgi:hypothetical protein
MEEPLLQQTNNTEQNPVQQSGDKNDSTGSTQTQIPTTVNKTNPQQAPHEESLEEFVNKREAEIKQKKVLFAKVKILVGVLLLTGVSMIGTYIWYSIEKAKQPVKPIVVVETPTDATPPQEVSSTWELERDDDLRIFVKKPPEAKVYTYSKPTSKLEIVYANNTEDFSKVSELNLNDGYIFRITPLALGVRDLQQIADIKNESFKLVCPATATVTKPQKTLLDTVDAMTFNVINCGVTYKVTYAPRFGIYYEVAQIYRGNIGIEQQYSSKTEELLKTFRFFPEDNSVIYDPYITFWNEEFKFIFKYPKTLDPKCCDINGPVTTKPEDIRKIIVVGNPTTYKDKINIDGLGVFADTGYYAQNTEFNAYVDKQKQTLVEDYKVVTGQLPITNESTVSVGKFVGTKLSGYSWMGNDLVYLAFPNNPTGRQIILVISSKGISGTDFQKSVDDMLSSFEFYKEKPTTIQ